MKGLVRKDLILMLKMNKVIILIMYLFVMAIAFSSKDEIYTIISSALFSLFMGMHLMMTMSYDGMTSWKQYELTLPMSKYKIIASKYLSSICLVPISVIGVAVIYIARYFIYHNFSFDQFKFSIVIAIILPVLWCSICLAIAQWFGYMKVQYVRMMGVLFSIIILNKMPKDMYNVAMDWIKEPILIVVGIAGIIVISYFISVIGYARKK